MFLQDMIILTEVQRYILIQ